MKIAKFVQVLMRKRMYKSKKTLQRNRPNFLVELSFYYHHLPAPDIKTFDFEQTLYKTSSYTVIIFQTLSGLFS